MSLNETRGALKNLLTESKAYGDAYNNAMDRIEDQPNDKKRHPNSK